EIKQLKEKLGHTPLEVLAGALLGILIALIVPM
ncbi:MAG: divergent PAP2 family protein, partial [Massilioclostridium sp.]|nr:divergent PAP2 family protein [Massilioclostridium sp.]